MQWTDGPQAGFSTNPNTWLPIPPSYKTINVEVESKLPDSELNWYERLIALRRTNPALRYGSMKMLDTTNPNVLSFVRSTDSSAVVVVLNCTGEPQTISLDPGVAGITGTKVKTLLTDDPALEKATSLNSVTIAPYSSWLASIRIVPLRVQPR
jgi:alpha-glucosidase